MIEEFRTDVTKTRKDGSRGALRIDYGDPRKPENPIAWLWKFIDGASTAGELYGRALVVLAAEQYASRLVVPSSQQHPPMRWPSHKDHAPKALAKLAGPHLPATLKQLEKAVAKAHAEHDTRTRPDTTAPQRAAAAAAVEGSGSVESERAEPEIDDEELSDDELGDDELVGEDDSSINAYGIEPGDIAEVGEVAGVLAADGAVYSDADPRL